MLPCHTLTKVSVYCTGIPAQAWQLAPLLTKNVSMPKNWQTKYLNAENCPNSMCAVHEFLHMLDGFHPCLLIYFKFTQATWMDWWPDGQICIIILNRSILCCYKRSIKWQQTWWQTFILSVHKQTHKKKSSKTTTVMYAKKLPIQASADNFPCLTWSTK